MGVASYIMFVVLSSLVKLEAAERAILLLEMRREADNFCILNFALLRYSWYCYYYYKTSNNKSKDTKTSKQEYILQNYSTYILFKFLAAAMTRMHEQ
jgi:hypothetical protein